MSDTHQPGALPPKEQLNYAATDLLHFAEDFLRWFFVRNPGVDLEALRDEAIVVVKKAGGKLPKMPKGG